MFYVMHQSMVTGAWSTVCGFSRYELAEGFITRVLNKAPGRYKIEKVYERES